MRNAILGIAVAISLGQPATANAFDLDRPYPVIMKYFGQPLVRDLVVGDVGWLGFNALCEIEKQLHVVASAPVVRPEGWQVFSITREAGGTVRMDIKMEGRTEATWVGFTQQAIRLCTSVLSDHYSEPDLIPVSTVNGFSSISEAMKD